MAEKKKFLLRIDSALWDDLHAWAADELRSVNGQIEYALKQAIAARRRSGRKPQQGGSPQAGPRGS
ncbi:MAG: hypothetical protein FJ288_15145 [Planctomycetes bacterium]|nr:hypothetical protein [Planctomycetota bacterium]